MKKRAQFDLDTECKFLDLPDQAIEMACIYEYMREARAVHHHASSQPRLPARFLERLPFGGIVRLRATLRPTGFPKPWKRLDHKAQQKLVQAMSRWGHEVLKELYPPIRIEANTRHNLCVFARNG